MRSETTLVDWWAFLVVALGLATPSVMLFVGLLNPSLGWLYDTGWITTGVGRMVLFALAIAGMAGAIGFIMRKSWAWWIVAVWAGSSVAGMLVGVVTGGKVGQVFAFTPILLMAYALVKRAEFGIGERKPA